MVESSRVYEYVEDMKYVGEISNADAVGVSSLDGQPPHTTIYLRVCHDLVQEARFKTSGCGFMIACVGALIELVIDQPVHAGLSITESQIVQHLQGLPEPRRYCATLAVIAMRDAIANYSAKQESLRSA